MRVREVKNDMLLILDTISLTKDTNHLVETTPLKEKFTRFTRKRPSVKK